MFVYLTPNVIAYQITHIITSVSSNPNPFTIVLNNFSSLGALVFSFVRRVGYTT